MLKRVKAQSSRFLRSREGHVAVMTSLMALPLLLAASLALDVTQAERQRRNLNLALDGAALSAVLNQTITDEERKRLAEDFLRSNAGDLGPKLDLQIHSASSSLVDLTASVDVPTSLLAAAGRDSFRISAESAATITRGGVICMMTLDPTSSRSFEVTGGAVFDSETCAVQVNSAAKDAATIDHGGQARAADFCVVGGANGPFMPHVNTECGAVNDPYADRVPPEAGACVDEGALGELLSTWQAESIGVMLQPGHYCNGLNLRAKNVTFAPGIYTISGDRLFFDYGTVARAEGVTFIFQGPKAYLEVNEGSKVTVKAPKVGPTAGIAFFQDTHTYDGTMDILPKATSTIRSGGNVSIVGTAYLPEHRILFQGGSLTESQAPATSFIGYQIRITDGAKIGVAVDHRTAGLPPIEPRHDESARLLK